MAALTSSYVGPLAGEVWTAPLKPFDVAAWKTVRFDVVGKLATATYEYSLDGGKRWAAFDPAAGLGQIKPVGGGADNLQFHLRLEGAPGQAPPFLVGAAVDYVAGPNNVRYLENSRLRIGIDPYGVRSLYDKRAGRAIAVAPETHDSLVMLVTKAPGNAPTSGQDLYGGTLDDFQLGGTAESPTLTMKHSLPSGISLVSTLKLLPDGQTEWQLRIDNRSPQEVAEVRFPVVTGVALGGDPSDDWAFVPKYWGQVWKNPSADPLITFWGPSMRWMDLWDGQSGVYLGLEDPKFEDWAFVYGGDRNGTTLSAHQRILAKPSGSWQSGTYRLAVHGGDWHQGGDIYRKYVATALQPPSTPPHVKWLLDSWCVQGSGYAGVMGWDMVYEAYGGLDNRPSYFMAANRQMMDGADAGYCGLYPYPSIAWGTTREYAQKLAIRKALGGMYTPYHNFQLWTPAFGHYNRVGVFPKSILPPDANVPDDDWYHRAASYTYTGSYQGGEADYYGEYQMAMGSKEWRDWLYDWTRRYLTWGTDGMYYDQFNMIYPNGRLYPDFPTYGCWAPALVQTFSKMVKDSRARNRYYTSSGEVCNDVYAQYNDMGMASGVWNRDDFWYYCNPHRLLIDGSWNGGLADFWGGWERERFIWQTGARFEEFVLPKENGQAWGASLLALRVATKSLLYDADFRDTVGLTITAADGKPLGPEPFFSGKHESGPFRGQSGRWFLFKQGAQSGAVVNFINTPTVAGATVHFSTKETGPLSSAVAWTLDGKVSVLRGAQQGDTYSFPLPEAECSSVVLAGTRLRPVVEWDLTGPATFGSKRSLTLKVTNPNSVPMSGTATLRLPASWPAAPAVKFGPLAPGAGASLLVPFTVGAKATKGRADIWCDVTSGGLTFSTYSFITVNDPVLIDFRGGPGDAHIWLKNLSTQPVTGTVTVSAPAPLRVSCAATFGVPADSEAKVPVTVANQEQLKRISELQARVTIGGQTTEVVRGVMPIVANGDFEADGAGDLEPDWWMCRKAVDVWAFEHKRLSPDAHGGKYSLMLDAPTPEDKFYRAYPVNGCAKGSTRYRISVWIKAESDKEVYFHLGGLSLGAGKTGPEWKQFTGEITTGPDPRGGWVYVAAYNGSTGKAWFDDIVVEEIK